MLYAAEVDSNVSTEFHGALSRAWDEAVAADAIGPLERLVAVWWPQAVFWSAPEGARQQLAWMDEYLAAGNPPMPFTWAGKLGCAADDNDQSTS